MEYYKNASPKVNTIEPLMDSANSKLNSLCYTSNLNKQ